MNKNEISENWNRRGFSCTEWEDPPGQVWEKYIHDVDELFMVIDGDVELVLDKKKLHPKPGEEVLIPANIYHSVRNIGTNTSHWLYGYKNKSE